MELTLTKIHKEITMYSFDKIYNEVLNPVNSTMFSSIHHDVWSKVKSKTRNLIGFIGDDISMSASNDKK